MDEAGWNAQRRTRLSHPAEAKRFVYWVVVDVGVVVDNAVVEGVMLGFVVLFVVDAGWEVGWEEAEGAGSEGLEALVGGILRVVTRNGEVDCSKHYYKRINRIN